MWWIPEGSTAVSNIHFTCSIFGQRQLYWRWLRFLQWKRIHSTLASCQSKNIGLSRFALVRCSHELSFLINLPHIKQFIGNGQRSKWHTPFECHQILIFVMVLHIFWENHISRCFIAIRWWHILLVGYWIRRIIYTRISSMWSSAPCNAGQYVISCSGFSLLLARIHEWIVIYTHTYIYAHMYIYMDISRILCASHATYYEQTDSCESKETNKKKEGQKKNNKIHKRHTALCVPHEQKTLIVECIHKKYRMYSFTSIISIDISAKMDQTQNHRHKYIYTEIRLSDPILSLFLSILLNPLVLAWEKNAICTCFYAYLVQNVDAYDNYYYHSSIC